MVNNITTKDELDKVLNETEVVIVDFNASWCAPCKAVGKTLEEISNENPNVGILSVNVEDADDLSDKFNIKNLPTIIVFKNGKEDSRTAGLQTKTALLARI